MTRKYFISHSINDKAFALELEKRLTESAWVDLYEIEMGSLLLEEISAGIESASDFVLLWSRSSSQSDWVRFEFHMAFVRWLEDKAINLRIVCLDDSVTPLYIRPFLQARGTTSPEQAAAALQGRPPHPLQRRAFFNRNAELGRIESAMYAPNRLAAWLWGVDGIGKKTLAAEAVRRLSPSQESIKRVPIGAGVAERELNLLVASALGTEPQEEGVPLADVISDTRALIERLVNAGGIWVFENTQAWLDEDAGEGRLLTQVLEALEAADGRSPGRLALFTSTRKPRLSTLHETDVEKIRVRGLDIDHSVALLTARGARGDYDLLREAAGELDGHPLALEIAAPKLPTRASELAQHRIRLATDLVGGIELGPDAIGMLEVVAVVDGPLPSTEIARHLELNSSQFRAAVEVATSYGLVETDDVGYLKIHPLLQDYFFRAFRNGEAPDKKLADLAERARIFYASLPPGSAVHVNSLLTTFRLLGLSNRLNEARLLRSDLSGALYETANQLYQEKRYELALKYAAEALTGDTYVDLEALILKAKCLAYLGNTSEAKQVVDELLRDQGETSRILRARGRISYIAKEWDTAVRYYERAMGRRPRALLLQDIGQAKLRAQDWAGARAALAQAVELGGDTAYLLNLYSQVLEHYNELVEAESMVTQAVRREPSNAGYRHRLGRIAQQRGNRNAAREHYLDSLRNDPRYMESLLSLASVSAELERYDEAKDALLRAKRLPYVKRSVLLNIEARIALAMNDLPAARNGVDAALREDRDRHNLVLALRVLAAESNAGARSRAQAGQTALLLMAELSRLGYENETNELRMLFN